MRMHSVSFHFLKAVTKNACKYTEDFYIKHPHTCFSQSCSHLQEGTTQSNATFRMHQKYKTKITMVSESMRSMK
jgi:hypothetical protein